MKRRMIEEKRKAVLVAVVCLLVTSKCVAQDVPHLRKQGNATQLIVGGKPFLVRGGELGNSTASDLNYLAPVWQRLVKLNLNTVLVPFYWELIEPEEGKFDFSLIDGVLQAARKNSIRVIPLWFGAWKNSMSTYVPGWVKTNQTRFPRSKDRAGNGIEILSPFSDATAKADAAAFRAVMRHLREVDSRDQTVIMVQVENEIGMIPDSRDRSDAANRLYAGEVPAELMNYLSKNRETLVPEMRGRLTAAGNKTAGTWEQVFGPGPHTEDIFMAWYFAKYTSIVTAAGKAEYSIPMYVNAALIRPGYQPGQYSSGGPLPHTMDIWRAAAQQIDLLAPDIYFPNFAEWCRRYDRSGNPFFIPEAGAFPALAVNLLYAVGQHNAIGVSPFAVESIEGKQAEDLTSVYDILSQLEPLLLANTGRGATAGLLSEGPEQREPQRLVLNGYRLNITYDKAATGSMDMPLSGGLVLAEGPDQFVIAGTGLTITFETDSPGEPIVGLLSVEAGKYINGKWVGRRLNGDQTHQGRHVRLNAGKFEIQRVKLYRYR